MAATAASTASSYYHPSRKKEGKQKICFFLIIEEKLPQKPSSLAGFSSNLIGQNWITGPPAKEAENAYYEGKCESQDGFKSVIIHPLGIEWRVGILATQTPGVQLARKAMGAVSGNSDATVVCLV